MRAVLRRLHDLVFVESDDPWSAEVIGYTHGAIGVVAGLALWFGVGLKGGWAALGGVAAFVLLRLLLASRYTAWLAALLGTAFVAGVCGALGWVGGQIVEVSGAPLALAIAGGLAGAALPLYAYVRYVRRCVVVRPPTERESLLPAPSRP